MNYEFGTMIDMMLVEVLFRQSTSTGSSLRNFTENDWQRWWMLVLIIRIDLDVQQHNDDNTEKVDCDWCNRFFFEVFSRSQTIFFLILEFLKNAFDAIWVDYKARKRSRPFINGVIIWCWHKFLLLFYWNFSKFHNQMVMIDDFLKIFYWLFLRNFRWTNNKRNHLSN